MTGQDAPNSNGGHAGADPRATLRRALDELEELKLRGMCEDEALTIAARSLSVPGEDHRHAVDAWARRLRDSLVAGAASNLAVARPLLERIPADQATDQPAGVVNHPAWTLAHLLHYHDAIAALIAGQPVADPALQPDTARFDEGSSPIADPAAYRAWTALVRQYVERHEQFADSLHNMMFDILLRPPGLGRWTSAFSDTAQTLTYLLIHHEAIHIGQIMAWERALLATGNR